MANEGSGGFWTTIPGVLTGAAALIAAVTGLYVALNRDHSSASKPADSMTPVITEQPAKPASPAKPPMGPLEHGIGLDHNDINAAGWQHVISPEACADLCYENAECKAMTYVISNQSCWLKYSVPGRSMNADEVSAVKQAP